MSEEDIEIETFGFKLERHTVTTEDGYILSLIRVSKKGQGDHDLEKVTKPKPAVLLVHGMACSGEMWFLNGEKSLPYQMVKEGYDCWVSTFRGTGQSIGHLSLKTNSTEYWDFSFHEVGLYDIPVLIDYILNTTGNAQLDYCGHSLGSAVLYILLSQKPEYCAKIKTMVALAPAPFVKHLTSKFYRFVIAPITGLLGKVRYLYCNPIPVKPIAVTVSSIIPSCFNREKVTFWFAKNITSRLGVYLKDQVDKDLISKLAPLSPAKTSIKVVSHLAQLIYTGNFQPFDHGQTGNIKKYGQSTVQPYDLQNVKIPVATIYSAADQLCVQRDIIHGASKLPNSIELHEVTESVIGHLDLMLGTDAPQVVFPKIIEIIKHPKRSCA